MEFFEKILIVVISMTFLMCGSIIIFHFTETILSVLGVMIVIFSLIGVGMIICGICGIDLKD